MKVSKIIILLIGIYVYIETNNNKILSRIHTFGNLQIGSLNYFGYDFENLK